MNSYRNAFIYFDCSCCCRYFFSSSHFASRCCSCIILHFTGIRYLLVGRISSTVYHAYFIKNDLMQIHDDATMSLCRDDLHTFVLSE